MHRRKRQEHQKMKFLILLSLLVLTAADEDKLQDKKIQLLDSTQNTSSPTQHTLLNGQLFPPSSFPLFGTSDISNFAYTGFNGNVPSIQTVIPDFFVAPATNVVNGAISAFPVTRTVLPGTSSVVSGIQSMFPATGNVFPAVAAAPSAVNAIPIQFPSGILPSIAPAAGVLDTGAAAGANGASTAYRFLAPEALSNLPAQGLQAAQQVGLAAIPAFASGILPSLANLQGQNIPTSIQQVLKNPTTNPSSNIPGLSTGNISSGPLTNVFRHA